MASPSWNPLRPGPTGAGPAYPARHAGNWRLSLTGPAGPRHGNNDLAWPGHRTWLPRGRAGAGVGEVPHATVLERPQDPAAHHHAVDLVGAVVEAGRPGVGVHPGQRGLVGQAEGAVGLDGPADHA